MNLIKMIADMMPKGRREYTEASLRFIEGAGAHGAKPQPFNYQAAVLADCSWISAAMRLRASTTAAQDLRLYVRKRSGRKCLWKTRPVSVARRRYMSGEGMVRPSSAVVGKVMDFGADYEEVVEDHPLKMLVKSPNPWMDGYTMTHLRTMWQDLTGNAYFYVVKDDSGMPVQLWPMPPQWVEIKVNESDFIESYVYGAETGRAVEFSPDEVIHFKRPNPGGMWDEGGLFYGKGNVERAWQVIQQNHAIHQMDISFFENMARPDFAVIVKDGVSEESITRFQQRLDQRLRGVRRSGKPVVISRDVDIKPLQWAPKDLQGREEVVEEIAAVMGVPVSLLKANDPNLASASAAFIAWRETEILPLLRMDEEALNRGLLPLFGIEDDAILCYDSPVPEDDAAALREDQALVSIGARTINEVRLRRGEEPVKGGDVVMVQAGMMPLRDALRPQRPVDVPRLPDRVPAPVTPSGSEDQPQLESERVLNGAQITAAQAIVASVTAGAMPRDAGLGQIEVLFNLSAAKAEQIMGSAGLSDVPTTPNPKPEGAGEVGQVDDPDDEPESPDPEEPDMDEPESPEPEEFSVKAMFHGEQACGRVYKQADADDTERDGESEATIREMEGEIAGRLDAAREEMAERAGEGEDAIEAVAESLERDVREIAERRLTDIASRGIRFGVAEAEELGLSITLDEPARLAARVAREASIELAGEVRRTTIERLRSTLADALERGATTIELRDEIMELDSVFGRQRAEAIARTESAFAWSEAHERSWEPIKDLVYKFWLVAPRACEFCESASEQFNAKEREVGETVFELGDKITGASGSVLKLDYRPVKGPPLHPNCRCRLITRSRNA